VGTVYITVNPGGTFNTSQCRSWCHKCKKRSQSRSLQQTEGNVVKKSAQGYASCQKTCEMNGLLCNKQVNFIDLVWTKTLNCKHLHKKVVILKILMQMW